LKLEITWTASDGDLSEFESGGTKTFGVVVPSTLFCSTSTISRFVERFPDGQCTFGRFLVCCSSTHGARPSPPSFVKVAYVVRATEMTDIAPGGALKLFSLTRRHGGC